MNDIYTKHGEFKNKLIILGFGAIAQAVLPLIFRHLVISPEQIIILNNKESGKSVAQLYGVQYKQCMINSENYYSILNEYLGDGDFLLNLAVNVSTRDLIKLCHKKNALYLSTTIEIWQEEVDNQTNSAARTLYALRDQVKAELKSGSTAVLTHGANPGLVSHFVKQALCNLAKDNQLEFKSPKTSEDWANLAQALNIKTIQVAEHDSQVSSIQKHHNEFVNTWSIDGLIFESLQPAEIGWGTHEKHWPIDGRKHQVGSQCAIYLDNPSAEYRVRTWTPLAGSFLGFLIPHAESISLAEYLSLKDSDDTYYRPTVHYAYSPCPDSLTSINELSERKWTRHSNQRLIIDSVTHGMDELGVLLLGNKKGAYWFGSQLSIDEARLLAPNNNATTLQVAAGVLSGVIWAINNPQRGLVEPEMMDYETVINIARPYLGVLKGYYSDWTPLKNRKNCQQHTVDLADPWQFKNILVTE